MFGGKPKATTRPLPPGFEDAELDLIEPELRKELRNILMGRLNQYPVYIHGDVGVGKSYAAALVFAHWEGPACWYDTNEWMQDVLTARSSRHKTVSQRYQGGDRQYFGYSFERTEKQLWRMMMDPNRLWVFDDICVEEPGRTKREIMHRISDCRQGKPTVYTSNKTIGELAELYDDRVASRVACGRELPCIGKDRRADKGTAADPINCG